MYLLPFFLLAAYRWICFDCIVVLLRLTSSGGFPLLLTPPRPAVRAVPASRGRRNWHLPKGYVAMVTTACCQASPCPGVSKIRHKKLVIRIYIIKYIGQNNERRKATNSKWKNIGARPLHRFFRKILRYIKRDSILAGWVVWNYPYNYS